MIFTQLADQNGICQIYQDMNPNFPVLWPPNIRQCTGKYRFLYPLRTTVVSNRSLAFSEPESQLKMSILSNINSNHNLMLVSISLFNSPAVASAPTVTSLNLPFHTPHFLDTFDPV